MPTCYLNIPNINFGRQFPEESIPFYHLDQLLRVNREIRKKKKEILIQWVLKNILGEDLNEHPFMTERPEVLMKNIHLNMDMMIGYTSQVILFLIKFFFYHIERIVVRVDIWKIFRPYKDQPISLSPDSSLFFKVENARPILKLMRYSYSLQSLCNVSKLFINIFIAGIPNNESRNKRLFTSITIFQSISIFITTKWL